MGQRVIYFASEQIKASARAGYAVEICRLMQPRNSPRKVIPAVASVVSEYQAQVPIQGLVDDGFGLHDFTSVC